MLSCLFCTLLRRTQPSHTAFFWEPRFHCAGSEFFWHSQECVFDSCSSLSIQQRISERTICAMCHFLCDKLQTSSFSRGQMFTRVSNLITAENREKTSKCNLTGCKATGHPLGFYGTGQGGSSEAK